MKLRNKWQMLLLPETQSFLGWSRHLFFVIGVLALSYAGFVLLDARLYQAYQTWKFEQALKKNGQSISNRERLDLPIFPKVLEKTEPVGTENFGIGAREGSPLGRIEISRIGLGVMIMEGIDRRTLRRAAGHIPGTPLPGQLGNVAIAGHRDTFFRPLRNIRRDDEITLTTLNGSYRYRVDSTSVVEPQETHVLDDSDDAILTLVTCYPFNFVGSAPKRFIVRARRVHDGERTMDR
jgi:LPXTG-site transpeptidase (sortase) family protein